MAAQDKRVKDLESGVDMAGELKWGNRGLLMHRAQGRKNEEWDLLSLLYIVFACFLAHLLEVQDFQNKTREHTMQKANKLI